MDENELSVGYNDLALVSYYSNAAVVREFRDGVAGRPNVRIVSGPKRYYSMKLYEVALALISDLQGEEDYLGSVDARIKALKETKFTDLKPPSQIDKQEKGISLNFKEGVPINFVSEKQYMLALKRLDELYAKKKSPPASAQGATSYTLERIAKTERPVVGADAEPNADLKSEYGRIINLLTYTLEEALYRPWRKIFIESETKRVSGETRKNLERAGRDMLREHKKKYHDKASKETDQEAIDRYVEDLFKKALEEKLKNEITDEKVDVFVQKRIDSNHAVGSMHMIMNKQSLIDDVLGRIVYEFFNPFFDYVKRSLSSSNSELSVQKELTLIASSDMTRDFLKMMYRMAKDKNRGSVYNKGREEYEHMVHEGVSEKILNVTLSGEDITNIVRIVADIERQNQAENTDQDGSIFLGGAEPDKTE